MTPVCVFGGGHCVPNTTGRRNAESHVEGHAAFGSPYVSR
jgi:hypothetical protein